MGDWNLNFVADRLQQTALDPTLWPSVLADISRCAGGAGALLFSADKRLSEPPASADLELMTRDYIVAGWHQRDERYRGATLLPSKGVVVDQDFTGPEEMRRSAYYQDFLARHKRRWFAGVGFEISGELWVVSIQRTIAQGPFLADEVEKLRGIIRPFADAATLTRKLSFARVEGLAEALELIGQPCIVFDDSGRVLTINALADGLIGSMIDVKSQTLFLGDPVSQSRFHSLLAAASTDALGPPQPAAASVRDRHGARHIVRAIALRGWARYAFTGARVLVLFEVSKPSGEAALAWLRSAFGLTPAEARLAIEISMGHSLVRAAENVGITYETARSYLKIIFSKTETRRQGGLAALLARCLGSENRC